MLWRIAAVMPHLRGRVLDLGCGTNDLLKQYRQVHADRPGAAESVGLDVFDWPGADRLITDAADLPYDNGSFDTVTIVAALNHIPNRLEALRECRRVVKEEGRLVLTMLPPRLSRVWHTIRKPWDADQTERGMQPGEVYGLSRTQIDRLLAQAGFEPDRHVRFMGGLNLLTLADTAPLPAPAVKSPPQRQPAASAVAKREDRPAIAARVPVTTD